MVRDLVFDPDGFFAARSDEPGLLGPTLVVLLTGAVGAISGFVMLQWLSGAMDGPMNQLFAVVGVSSIVGAFVGTLVVWAVYAVVFYLLSGLFGGEGSFRDTFAFTGWGFLPAIFSGLVSAVVMWYALGNVPPPESMQEMASFQRTLRSQQVFVVGGVVGIAFQLWQWFIWTFALRHARSLDLRDAAITVGIPVGLSIAWNAYNLL